VVIYRAANLMNLTYLSFLSGYVIKGFSSNGCVYLGYIAGILQSNHCILSILICVMCRVAKRN